MNTRPNPSPAHSDNSRNQLVDGAEVNSAQEPMTQAAKATPFSTLQGLSHDELATAVDVHSDERITIFKSVEAMSEEEEAFARRVAIENLIEAEVLDDGVEYKDTDLVGDPFDPYRREIPISELIRKEMNACDQNNFDYVRHELDVNINGSLYAIMDFELNKGYFWQYKRLTDMQENPGYDNIKTPVDNLSKICDFSSGSDYADIFYENGDVFTSTFVNRYVFREFVSPVLSEGDPHLEALEDGDHIYEGNTIDEEGFEELLFNVKTIDEYNEVINKFTRPIGHYVADIFGWQ